MARVVKNAESWHAITIRGDGGGPVILVGRGRTAYLVAHAREGRNYESVSGPKTLRALARAILRTVPAPRRTKRRK